LEGKERERKLNDLTGSFLVLPLTGGGAGRRWLGKV